MKGGVFAVSRGIFDDPDFPAEPFTQREAFMWLVASAAWKGCAIRGSKGRVRLERGEFCYSIRFLAERWKWSKSRVARFLDALKNRDTLRDTRRDGERIWIISKYNDFQKVSLPKRDSNGDDHRDAGGTAAGQRRDKEENRVNQDKPREGESAQARAPSEAVQVRQHLGSVLDDDHRDAVIAHRRTIRKPLTVRAAKLLAAQFAKVDDPNGAADLMIQNAWTGFDAQWWENRRQPRGHSPPGTPPTDLVAIKRRLRAIQTNENPNGQPDAPTDGYHRGHVLALSGGKQNVG